MIICHSCRDMRPLVINTPYEVPWLCPTCVFWRNRDEAERHPLVLADVRANGHLFVIDELADEPIGPTLDIRYLQGSHLRTARLCFVSVIPQALRLVLPDNAIITFVEGA